MRVGEPNLTKRPHAHFDAEPDEEKREGQGRRAWHGGEQQGEIRAYGIKVVLQTASARRLPLRSQRATPPDHGGCAGNLHHHKEFVGGAYIFALLVFETDERVAGQRHHLPEEKEEPHYVGSAQQTVHCREKEQEIGIVAPHAVCSYIRMWRME